uniref:Uncharacterized protein n=1 Tax=Ursus americanus TaxID=9643 RepID=A0A452QCS7_URSAM
MTILLALLLVVDLPRVETNGTMSGKQGKSGPLSLLTGRRQCHVCEMENSFACTGEANCNQGVDFCSSVAVSKYLSSCWASQAGPYIQQESGSVQIVSTGNS